MLKLGICQVSDHSPTMVSVMTWEGQSQTYCAGRLYYGHEEQVSSWG
jgi:hypothetical protein